MSGMTPSTRFWPKASNITSMRKSQYCSQSSKASLMPKGLAQKWKLENNSFNNSRANTRGRRAENRDSPLVERKQDKELADDAGRKQPERADSFRELRVLKSGIFCLRL